MMRIMDDIQLVVEAARKMKDIDCPFKEECMDMPISHLEQFCGCYNEIAKELNEEYRGEDERRGQAIRRKEGK